MITKYFRNLLKLKIQFSTNKMKELSTIESFAEFKISKGDQLSNEIDHMFVHYPLIEAYLNQPQTYENEINKIRFQTGIIIKNYLDPQCLNALTRFQSESPDYDLILIKNFPFKYTGYMNKSEAEILLLGMSYLLNMKPFSYMNQFSGRLISNISPLKDKENLYHSASSKTELPLHNEDAFDDNRADYIMLYCLISNKDAMTKFLSTEKILETLPINKRQHILNVGLKNDFLHKSSINHDTKTETRGQLFYQNEKSYSIRMRFNMFTEGLNEEATEVVNILKEHIQTLNDGIILEEGDLCVWCNHTVLHGRSSFLPTYSNNERLLLRMFLSKNLSAPIVK